MRVFQRSGSVLREVLLACLLGLLLFAFPSWVEAATVVEGEIRNGTTQGKALAEEVRLIEFGKGMQAVETIQNVEGEFRFENASLPPGPYMIQVLFQGVNYNEPFRLEGEEARVDVTVYETTDSREGIQVFIPHLLMRVNGERLEVLWVYEIHNHTEPPKTYLDPNGTLRFDIPENIVGSPTVSVSRGKMPLRLNPIRSSDGEGYQILTPMKPGTTSVSVSYAFDYSERRAGYEMKIFYDVAKLDLLSGPADLEIESPRFEIKERNLQQDYAYRSAEGIRAREPISFLIHGGSTISEPPTGPAPERGAEPTPGDVEPEVVAVPNRTDRAKWPILVGLFLIFFVSVVATLEFGKQARRRRIEGGS